MSKTLAVSDIDKLVKIATEDGSEEVDTVLVSDRGVEYSVPRRCPSDSGLSKVHLNYAPSGRFAYLYSEEFVCREEEALQQAAGGRKKAAEVPARLDKRSQSCLMLWP